MYFIHGFKFHKIKVLLQIIDLHQNSKDTYDIFLGHLEFCEDVNLLIIGLFSLEISIC